MRLFKRFVVYEHCGHARRRRSFVFNDDDDDDNVDVGFFRELCSAVNETCDSFFMAIVGMLIDDGNIKDVGGDEANDTD